MAVEIGFSEEGEVVVLSAIPIGRTYWLILGDRLTLVELEDDRLTRYLMSIKRKEDAIRIFESIVERGSYRVFALGEERERKLSEEELEQLRWNRGYLKYGLREAVLRAERRRERHKRKLPKLGSIKAVAKCERGRRNLYVLGAELQD